MHGYIRTIQSKIFTGLNFHESFKCFILHELGSYVYIGTYITAEIWIPKYYFYENLVPQNFLAIQK